MAPVHDSDQPRIQCFTGTFITDVSGTVLSVTFVQPLYLGS